MIGHDVTHAESQRTSRYQTASLTNSLLNGKKVNDSIYLIEEVTFEQIV